MTDLVNELQGAGALLESITANGEDRSAQLVKLFVSFNARISKLPPTTPADVVDAITAAIGDGPWSDRQATSLLALTESVTRPTPTASADEKLFQHCLRCNVRIPLTRCTRERCSQYRATVYTC